jgi:hypothetical protein
MKKNPERIFLILWFVIAFLSAEEVFPSFPSFNSKKWVTIYFGQSITAFSRARYIFFYGWDSYILFKKGRPVARGNFFPLRSFITYDFLSKDHLSRIQSPKIWTGQDLSESLFIQGLIPFPCSAQMERSWSSSPIEMQSIPVSSIFFWLIGNLKEACSSG